ncbi:hypothetical protein HNR23_003063 [Nocardiopsis mwathae]|uniref:Uncharacterized protein n=1 Tax=Nocardiopsis mwathae TaxID=1472723 RepID=A0A7W9YIW6_9ACTN|nr:hypothetical protein [Nocardiopsis mwathae]MBB6173003.1 hypothetical protein [Nocardiopsis mwathae]
MLPYEMDDWAQSRGYDGYRDRAYARGGVDADLTAPSFVVENDTAENVDIMRVEVRVTDTAAPLDGASS